jgi:hypothetical protein
MDVIKDHLKAAAWEEVVQNLLWLFGNETVDEVMETLRTAGLTGLAADAQLENLESLQKAVELALLNDPLRTPAESRQLLGLATGIVCGEGVSRGCARINRLGRYMMYCLHLQRCDGEIWIGAMAVAARGHRYLGQRATIIEVVFLHELLSLYLPAGTYMPNAAIALPPPAVIEAQMALNNNKNKWNHLYARDGSWKSWWEGRNRSALKLLRKLCNRMGFKVTVTKSRAREPSPSLVRFVPASLMCAIASAEALLERDWANVLTSSGLGLSLRVIPYPITLIP